MENKKAMAPKKFEENESNPMNSAFCNSTNVQASKNLWRYVEKAAQVASRE